MENGRVDPSQSGPGAGPGPDTVWGRARREYLSGVTAATICQRYGMSLRSFRLHARAGGWRRIDHPECDIAPEAGEFHPDDSVSFADLADQAFLNLRRAIGGGRAAEAASWMRLFDRMADRARSEVLADLPDAVPPEPAREPERVHPPARLTSPQEIESSMDSSALADDPGPEPEVLHLLHPVFFGCSPEPGTGDGAGAADVCDPDSRLDRPALGP